MESEKGREKKRERKPNIRRWRRRRQCRGLLVAQANRDLHLQVGSPLSTPYSAKAPSSGWTWLVGWSAPCASPQTRSPSANGRRVTFHSTASTTPA